jgi:predicted ABC-type ATPase
MERRPELTIIAGPNGAGKSRLCPFYVSAKSFDGDKLMLDLRREHPDWPDRWVSGTVASQLEKQKAEALEQHKDFAFETNFSSDMVMHMIEEFRAAGFKISLCYFGLRRFIVRHLRPTSSLGHLRNDYFDFRGGWRR